MKGFLLTFFISVISGAAFSQCLTLGPANTTDVSCFGGNDGTISIDVVTGTAPFTYELILFIPGSGSSLMGSVTTSATSAIFMTGNSSLLPAFETFGIQAISNFPAGSEYRVTVSASGGGSPLCEIKNILGISITEPPQLAVATNDIDPDCDANAGAGTGEIDISVSGGTLPYTIQWTGPTPVPDGTEVTGSILDAGAYAIVVTDGNGCTTSLDIDLPVATLADAGAPTAVTCNMNSFALSGNTPGPGETGKWTGPPGVTFSPDANTPNATANNLLDGVNTLTWTITDAGAVCPGTFDEIQVTFSPAISLSTTITGASCKGSSTGAIDLLATGGIAPYTFVWSNGAATEDLTNIPAGTYSVTVTDNVSCSAVLSGIVVGEPALAVSGTTTQADVACFGGSTGSITLTGEGGVGPYDFSIDGGGSYAGVAAADHTFIGLAAGDHQLMVKDANGCESPVITVSIAEPATAVSGTTAKTDVTCFGASTGSITITAAGGVAPYDFSIDGGTTYTALDAPDQTFPNLVADTYDLMIRDANGCQSPLIQVTITEPSAAVSGSTTAVDVSCFGASTGSITITGAGGVAPYDFSIDGGGTYAELDLANHTFPNLPAGAYDLTVRDANGCESALIQVTITEPLSAVSGNSSTVDVLCFGASTGSITITGGGGVGPYDFSIDGGATYPVLAQPDNPFTGLPAGTHSLRVRDANGCESAVIPVTIAQPSAAVSGTASHVNVLCFGSGTGSITITGAGGVAPYDFSIDGGATYSVLAATDHTFPNVAAGTYNLRVRDVNGCETAVIPVTITEPVAAVSGTTSQVNVLCFGASTGSIGVTGAGGIAPYDFSIDGGATYSVLAAADHTFLNVAAGTHNVRVRDANGCETAVIPVTITEPAAAVSGSTTQVDVTCFGAGTGAITITGGGGVGPYNFSIDGGATYTGPAAADKTFPNLAAGTYDMMVRDANGCQTAVIPVTIAQPAAAVSGATTPVHVTCFGLATGAISVTGAGGFGPYDFSIDGGGTYPVLAAADNTFPGLSAGIYNLMVRDANGCESASIPVTITQPAEVTSVVSAVGAVTVCEGNALPDVVFTFTGIAPFDFTYTDGTTPINISDHPTTTFTIATAAPGSYSVTALTDNNGCVSANLGGSITVTEETAPIAEAGSNQLICSGQTATLSGSAISGSAATGSWSIVSAPVAGDGALSDEDPTGTPDIVTFTASVAGAYTLRLTTDDPAGICEPATDDVIITVTAAATVEAGPVQTICVGATVTMAATFTGTTGIDWTTSGNGTFDDPTSPTAVYTPDATDIADGTVTLTATTQGPCAQVQDNVVITIVPAPTVSAGTPPATICSDATVVLSGTFGGSATGLVWTTDGNGSFNDVTDSNATYTPGSDDISSGTVTLTATATGSCSGTFDQVVIAIDPAPTVDAGGPQTICLGSNVMLSATLGGSAVTVKWESSGDGTFDNDTDPNTGYTPGVNDLTNGTVTLTATTNNPAGPCLDATDDVVVTFIPIPGDQTTAGNETWIGYVYDDAGVTGTIPDKIDFDNARYRGFITETDISSMTALSSYDAATDAFDLNLDISGTVHGPNLCNPLANDFSVRYKMSKTFNAGVYRFTVGADDGVRLLIDGVNVLPVGAFDLHSYTSYMSDPICLSAAVHELEIHYFDNTAQSRLNFSYEEVPALATVSPVTLCVASPTPTLTVSSTDGDVIDFNWYKTGVLLSSGSSYTPSAAELDMTAAGTTTFSVTAQYACGETQPVDVVVDVLNSASLDIEPQTICESGGSIDLRTLVTETPSGGVFTFSNHPNISGNNFDPSGLVAGSTVSILVDYSTGPCVAPQGTLELTITNSASTTVPASPVFVCESSPIDLTTIVSAVPAGGAFTFSGHAGITGNNFDPTGLTGVQTITVDYAAGGCVAPSTSFEIDVVSNVSIALNNAAACENGSPLNLLSLVTPTPAGGTLSFAGPGVSGNLFDASAQSGVVNINVDYDLNGCTDTGILTVTVLDSSDPLCTGGNCASVVIIPKPEPATCTNSDGRMVMSIKPFKTTGTKITIDGISSTNLPISRTIFNDSIFDALPVGNYNYTIEYGDPSCVKTGQFSIDQSGTVGTPVISNLVSPLCFGTATGSLTLDVPGETGNVLEWSLDGGLTDPFKPFIAGSKISGIPAGPAPSFNQVISVRRNIADVCFSSITIPIPESVPAISATFGITPSTCNDNDGAITGILASGGNDAPFSYSIDGGLTFQASPEFDNLAGGSYTLRVRDAGGCESDFTANVTFPGFINSVISKHDADCSNGGDSGSITVMVTDPGVFGAALTTDQFNEPEESEYLAYSNPSIVFNSLPRGEYFVYLRSNSGGCATRSAPIQIFGVYDVTFDLQPDCNNNMLSMALLNVTGDASGPQVQIHVTKKMSSDPTEIINKQFPANGEIYLDHDEYTFLQTPGAYDIKIVQLQEEVYCPMFSQTVEFTVPEPLDASIGLVAESYPDIATGNLEVTGFSGGVFPYDVRIELDSAASFALPYHVTEFEEAGINENQQIVKTYDGVPAGRYKVEVMDAQGCVVDLVARVPLDADIFIPNVFTPNGDGANDVFFIRNLPQEPSINELIITNRWGKQIFTSANYQNNWDGEGTADGIYFYRLQILDGETRTGWVEVIRGPKP